MIYKYFSIIDKNEAAFTMKLISHFVSISGWTLLLNLLTRLVIKHTSNRHFLHHSHLLE